MKHRFGYSKLNRNSDQRKALLRGLCTQFLMEGRIVTTLEKAKSLRPMIEKIVTIGKKNTVASRRLVAKKIYGADVLQKLFTTIAPENSQRPGGYTRILKLGFRPGDHGRVAIIEFVNEKLIKANSETSQTK